MIDPLREAWAPVWRTRGGRTGILILAAITLVSIVAPWFLPAYWVQEFATNAAPGAGHLMGTDNLGRDLMARVTWGGRVSLTVAGLSVALAMTLGALVGLTAGYLGGWVDALLMRLVDGAMAIPRLFVLLLVVAATGKVPLAVLILVLGTTGWFGVSRLVRGEVLRVREEEFVHAAEALGAGRGRVIFRHLLPNSMGPLLVAATLAVGDVILLEAGLSFLGYGVQPPAPSWGGLILDARPFLTNAPWLSLFPGLAIVITVLSVNLVGEALREALDTRSLAADTPR